jgi:hypothetical protein
MHAKNKATKGGRRKKGKKGKEKNKKREHI